MTEAEWLAADKPQRLLMAIRKWSERRGRLFALACCQRVVLPYAEEWRGWPSEDLLRVIVEVAELVCDGMERTQLATLRDRLHAIPPTASQISQQTGCARRACGSLSMPVINKNDVASVAECCARLVGYMSGVRPFHNGISTAEEEFRIQAALLRDVFGNPFRPLACDPAWLTSTVVALAEGIYADRAFDRMPILADALQDAGCDSDDILAHCRDTQRTHVRGCWVIDLLTDRG